MPYELLRYRVHDLSQWHTAFEAHRPLRQEAGCVQEQVFVDEGDPEEVTVLLEWESSAEAHLFTDREMEAELHAVGLKGDPQLVAFLDAAS